MTPSAFLIDARLLWCLLIFTSLVEGLPAQIKSPAVPTAPSPELEAKIAQLWNQLPAPQKHFEGVTETQAAQRLVRQRNYQELLREKVQDKWFAALVSEEAGDAFAIKGRFTTLKSLVEFMRGQDALAEVWAYPEAGAGDARRIPATELAARKKQTREPPNFLTLTYRDSANGAPVRQRVEFGFKAAETALAANRGYQIQREMQLAAREVLAARDASGKLNAQAQWDALVSAVGAGRLAVSEMPPASANPRDLFVAFEYEVDEFNNFRRVARVYRESQIEKRIVAGARGGSAQILVLSRPGDKQVDQAWGFRVRGAGDELEPAPNPILGQDFVELRVRNLREPDPRKWNVLEFGEPEILKQSALAKFSLISAHLEKKRKETAIKKSSLDMIAEPIFAGLNIGGGLAMVPVPLGEAARLGYNATVTPWFIPDVPNVRQMRELFQLMAAKDRHPRLKTKPGPFLDENDFKQLQASAKELTDADVVEYLQRISNDDLKGMLRLARMQRIDSKVSNLLGIMADAGKVSGWTDEAGFQRDVFNSVYFSVNGEVSIKNIIAVLAGGRIATPLSGISLKTLSEGGGPPEAWLQYLNFTVDIRAVINTLARLSHRKLADKELKKPFPYGPRMSDVSAYEIRIFGFPLLFFYKRGLLKDDYAAYQNDYAYGLSGSRIVEHFATRADMDAEIRAGRMVALGYVRVSDGKGGWKETNLAVFAHRPRAGKYQGRTTIIIYGLRAYEEHSQLMQREYLRFKEFEKALELGGVIEQVVEAEEREQIPGEDLEPRLQTGPTAADAYYAPLLGELLEWRRLSRRHALGLALSPEETEAATKLGQALAARGIRIADTSSDPLQEVDQFHSSFVYRKFVDGKWRLVRLINIPSHADINRELAKAEENRRIEQARREAVSSTGDGIALFNKAEQVNGRYELGALVEDTNGKVIGVRAGAAAVQDTLAAIGRLPVTEQARLRFNNFAATMVELDVEGNGRREKIFLTVEFPLDKILRHERTNALSGVREILSFENGLWKNAVTEQRIVELDYDAANKETGSRLYFNAGTRKAPVKGALLEETRTAEMWFRDLNRADADPYGPMLSKIKTSHVTGEIVCETYGLFPLPVVTVDEQFVTTNQFNSYGVWLSANVRDNGRTAADFQRAPLVAMLQPEAGPDRFVLTSTIPLAERASLRDLQPLGYQTTFERNDLVTGLAKTVALDLAHFGRKASESFVDAFDGTASFGVKNTLEYRDDFFFGLIPFKTQNRGLANSALLREVETTSYEPLARRLTGVEISYTGRVTTNVWDHRWENPVVVETAARRTVSQYDRSGASFTGTSSGRSSGEPLSSFSGQFDPATKTWQVNRAHFYRPGIINRTATEKLSGFGRWILTRTGDAFETRPGYNADGVEVATQTSRRNPATGQFDLTLRLEDDYQWTQGAKSARIRTFVDGQPHDTFRCVVDSEGRIVTNDVRQLPGLEWKTVLTHEGDSERVTKTEIFQNNQLRETSVTQPEQKQADGSYLLPVKITPSWGLVVTQTFLLGDPLARPLAIRHENGESVRVTDWFAGTPIARVSELIDRNGRAKERFVKTLNRGTNGTMPFDLTARYKLNHWGAAGLAEEEACLRGTDLALFTDSAEERIYFDTARTDKAPWYATDPQGMIGLGVSVGQTHASNVVAVFNAQIQPPLTPAASPVMLVESLDLRGLFFHLVTRQTRDRAGKIVEESMGRLPNLGPTNYSAEALLKKLAQTDPTRRLSYRYDPGWLVEQTNAQNGGGSLIFTHNPPPTGSRSFSVNEAQSREWLTGIEEVQLASVEERAATDLASSPGFLHRRMHTPRELERNPFMPDRQDAWTAWTASELRPGGEEIFDSELIYDAQGRLSVARANKTSSSGGSAVKVAFNVASPPPGLLQEYPLTAGEQTVRLINGANQDFSESDFVYFYLLHGSNTVPRVTVTDAASHTMRVGQGDSDFRKHVVSRWPVGSAQVRWLPDRTLPKQGSTVSAPAALVQAGQVVVLSVHDLARAGLDIRRVAAFDVIANSRESTSIRLSPLQHLVRGGKFIRDEEGREFSHEQVAHSSGLQAFISVRQRRTEPEIQGWQKMAAVAEFNGRPAARSDAPGGNPRIVVLDNSDADSPRPLYAVSSLDGHFLEHYKVLKRGDAQVYTVVQGFELPRFEVFNPQMLDDDLSPSYVAYGDHYKVTHRNVRGHGWLGRQFASLHNRVEANAYKFGGVRLLGLVSAPGTPPALASHFNYSTLQDASQQAADINQAPMLAEALLPARELPWGDGPSSIPAALTPDWKRLDLLLDGLHQRFRLPDKSYSLIPTAPDTIYAHYVDTVKEAELIILAVKLGNTNLAGELLGFYGEKSDWGERPLHASYDARAGTAMTFELTDHRARHAKRTAEAQLAMADAAFGLGFATSEPKWLLLGKNLLSLCLSNFMHWRDPEDRARGIADYEVHATNQVFGFKLWPEAEIYSLRVNARAYLLLKQLNQSLSTNFADNAWQVDVIKPALRNQEAWLANYILPQVERSGVVPKGLFQIQDINRKSTASAVERWTSADAWLTFLEAADALGVPRENTRRWLENLARVHGVRVNGAWGLDWSVPLFRPDVISPELTAKFRRVAHLLGHDQAERFAIQALNSLQNEGVFPFVVTGAPATRSLQSGEGFAVHPQIDRTSWPLSLGVYKELRELTSPGWEVAKTAARLETLQPKLPPRPTADLIVCISITAAFYLSILLSAVVWWRYRALRRKEHARVFPDPLVPEAAMQRAEERWAKRVLGMQTPNGAEKTRFSNGPVEQNFLMQLRVLYKLVLEWRRQENGWAEDDARLAEDETDDWLNGVDEFACLVGIYMRWVIKAGAKDGFRQKDVLAESEDSNHIWSRLVMCLSEYYWGLLTLSRNYNNLVTQQDKASLYGQMSQLLNAMGVRQRAEAFDARKLFNFPADRSAMDLLIIQQPGMTLDKVMIEASKKLRIPYLHIVRVIERYKEFKQRENPYPIHPYLIEFAKVMPHFGLMGLGALVWYNQGIGDSPIVPYLWSLVTQYADRWSSLLWALPLLGSLALSVMTHFVKIYRFEAPMLQREKTELIFDATLTSLFVKRHSVMPKSREGRWWNPNLYEWTGWALRGFGFLWLAIGLLREDTPSFATFLVVKGLLAMWALAEVAAVALPLATTAVSKYLQDRVTANPQAWEITKFLNRLNLTATRPASPLWLSFKYHTQPSVPTGSFASMTQAVVFYFVLAAVFFFIGGYLCQQIFSLWFMDAYLSGADVKLFVGGLLFWNTMYLLRYGLFLMFTGVASLLASFPLKGAFGLLASTYLLLVLFGPKFDLHFADYPTVTYSLMALGIGGILFERQVLAAFGRSWPFRSRAQRETGRTQQKLQQIRTGQTARLGVVYMSGDDLSYQKLTADLLMTRWNLLRDKLDSGGIRLLTGFAAPPDDATLRTWFQTLHETERKFDVTLWHPLQLVLAEESKTGARPAHGQPTVPRLRPELGLNLVVASIEQRNELLTAWHLRRWLVSMMSTAGHSQDTAINLVDIALRLDREGLAANTAFYLIQNKYDNNENNRPSQTPYDRGELGQRNKLSRLLCEVAPGTRAYSIQNWTPFGFKAGGLTGMDLVHEESLKLTTLLLLDRNATVHDLDALMEDLAQALTDPDVVIIIPGRGTTNTLTSLGQGSQMVEEGHRSFLKGLMALLGGRASESVGTGWGNILAVFYGRVQNALVDAHSLKMPLTSRMRRGSSFQVRTEGLIGLAPHAVGISEDTWAVSQTAHNAIALGGQVKFLLSRAFWHKIRETWSHAEWLASFPRWSGGYLQMMHDPIMQRINDFGPSSVFAKEIRANSGRNFLSAPFALLNILLMPLAIMLDVTPFVQILIVLWNFGFVMNQILTVHGLNAYLEGCGFYRIPALGGAMIAGALALLQPRLQPYAPGLITLGLLAGGFLAGLGRWLNTRVRDVILFGPQLILHALGQMVRQSLEFVVSGASPEDAKGVNMAFRAWVGPREDRPLDRFPNIINLRTVIWVVGLVSLILNLFALSNLDMLNVLLLLPSLLFSVGALVGPFLLKPWTQAPLGKWALLPRVLGWLATLAFFTMVSLFATRSGWLDWLSLALLAGVFLLLLSRGLKYAFYGRKVSRAKQELAQLLAAAGTPGERVEKLASQILASAGDTAKVRTLLEGSISATQQESIIRFAGETCGPLLRAPGEAPARALFADSRWASEFSRSFVLSLFTLVWFFVVPVPGLFVFTAGEYRLSVGLAGIMRLVYWAVGLVLLSAWLGRLIQWFDQRGVWEPGLRSRIVQSYRQFQALVCLPGRLSAEETARTYALFTDAQTFLDQRSYAYARRLLELIEASLSRAASRQDS